MVSCEGVHPNDSDFHGGRSVQRVAYGPDLVEMIERKGCDIHDDIYSYFIDCDDGRAVFHALVCRRIYTE